LLNAVPLPDKNLIILETFKQLGVKDHFIKALEEINVETPSDIQIKAIPFLLNQGTDFIGQAQTGTGKTIAFGIPLLQRMDTNDSRVQAVILSPTRELGQQIAKQLFKLTKYSNKIFIEAVYGGEKIENQIRALSRPTHIVVATPGRLIDLLEKKALDLSQVETIVLDEADEMLSMGFREELDAILKYTVGNRNTWLFSATLPANLKEIIGNHMSADAHKVVINKRNIVNPSIEHQYVTCDPRHKFSTLIQFLNVQRGDSGIIFCRTKINTQNLVKQLLSKNFVADAIHGDLQQREREKAMRAFKNHKIQLLVTTDVSARGIDVDDLGFVVHYELPEKIEYYTHRSGRTARAGKKGVSISIIDPKEVRRIRQIEQSLQISFKRINPS
jgi:ATP-dependent RNA helicase DeaD